MDNPSSVYVPGISSDIRYPLQRFLPPIPDGMFGDWLRQNASAGSWVIDPFGTSPFLPLEAAKAGYKVLVICNNPVLQFYIEMLARAPTRSDFLAALSDLSKERRQGERLEIHLQSLYQTDCPQCNHPIPADSFIWRRDQLAPQTKFLRCEFCHAEGEFPVSDADIQRINAIGGDSLHRARALERVNIDADVMTGAQEVLETYLARPLHFLFTLINRVERLQTNEYHKKLLFALILVALDQGNSIWPWPPSRARPKQLSIPSQFREKNLWQAFETGIDLWTNQEKPIQITFWPNLPTEPGGICLFKGRLAAYQASAQENPIHFAHGISALPRPNQAFWSLSALWSGWLWGKSAVYPLRGALERRRFDWFWYSLAIHQTLAKLRQVIHPDSLFWGVIAEAEIGFISGTIIGAESAGFSLNGFSLRSDQDLAQCTWKTNLDRKTDSKSNTGQFSKNAIAHYLTRRNEPAEKLQLFSAAIEEIARSKVIPITKETPPYYLIREYQQEIIALLNDAKQFSTFSIHLDQQEREMWWMSKIVEMPGLTHSDQVETFIRQQLVDNNHISFHQLDRAVCKVFTGLLTPSHDWVKKCLSAYADPDKQNPGIWHLREKETPENRAADKALLENILLHLGQEFGFEVDAHKTLVWLDRKSGQVEYRFNIMPNSIISEILLAKEYVPANNHVIIIPGSHSKLLTEKFQSNPQLAEKASRYGRIAKNRLFQKIFEKGVKKLEDFDNLLNLDPPAREEPIQISIF